MLDAWEERLSFRLSDGRGRGGSLSAGSVM